jgi:hypothetical protein
VVTRSRLFKTALFCIALAMGASGFPAGADAQPAVAINASAVTPATSPSLWSRVVLVGASVSAGFTLDEPLGGPDTLQLRLDRYVDAAIAAPHEPVRNLGNALFFMRPEASGRMQVSQALAVEPTLVVGIDFLFWHLYGEGPSEAARLERFESALKLLETIHCPLVIGNIPDASIATNSVLHVHQVPSAETMLAANRRLESWASTRPAVRIVPLNEIMRRAKADEPITVREYEWRAGTTRGLLQPDRLHTSTRGCAALALAIADAALRGQSTSSSSDVRWDPEEIRMLALEAAPYPPGPGRQVSGSLVQ